MNINKVNIAVIGQGYVGLPLAIEFEKKYPTIGFDINQARIDELKKGIDHTNEAKPEQLRSADQLTFSANINDIKGCNV
jgi:UDP-N-acetyl-D-galactosamine dehydrogenase